MYLTIYIKFQTQLQQFNIALLNKIQTFKFKSLNLVEINNLLNTSKKSHRQRKQCIKNYSFIYFRPITLCLCGKSIDET